MPVINVYCFASVVRKQVNYHPYGGRVRLRSSICIRNLKQIALAVH